MHVFVSLKELYIGRFIKIFLLNIIGHYILLDFNFQAYGLKIVEKVQEYNDGG